jgi:chromosome segregation ATPase
MEDSASFVANASSKPRSYGHNKFQIQLQEANSKIEELQSVIDEKTNELELFKNSMRTFHLQLQDKNIEISNLNNELNQYKTNLETITFDLNKLQFEKKSHENCTQEEQTKLYNENMELVSTINNLHKTNHQMNEKYQDLKVKYQTTLDLLEKKSTDYTSLEETYKNTLDELNLVRDINLTQEKEIDTLKQEIFQYHNELSILKTQLFEKDVSLGELHKKLCLERYRITGKLNELDNIQKEESENNATTIDESETIATEPILNSRPIKITTQRGVKISRR